MPKSKETFLSLQNPLEIHSENKIFEVLVIEDDLAWQRIIAAYLKVVQKNMNICFVQSGEHAMRNLEKKIYDLIISDFLLEGQMTGLEVWKACQEIQPQAQFLLTSGFDFCDMSISSQMPIELASKPFDHLKMKKILSHLLIPTERIRFQFSLNKACKNLS